MTTERIDELLALAALGELTDVDERELAAVAQRDSAVADELAQVLASAAAIQASEAEEPPAGLRADVLASIHQTPQESLAPRQASPPVHLDERRRRRWAPIVAAVAAVAVLSVGGVVLVANEASAPDGVAAVVDAADAQELMLDGELSGTLTVVYSESEDAIVVEGEGLPTLDASQTYQLWLVDDAGAVSAGLFHPDDAGVVAQRLDGVDPTGFVLGVTAEPAGGSESPTLPILAST